MSDDRERLERYLEWQRAHGKDRPARRRRRMTRVLVAAVLGVAGAGLGAWWAAHWTAPGRVAAGSGPSSPAAPADVGPPAESSRAEPPRIAPPEPSKAVARPTPRAARGASRQPSAPPAPFRAERAESPEVAAAIAPVPQPPAPATPAEPPIAGPEPQAIAPVAVAPEPGATATPDPPAVAAEPEPPPSPPVPASAATAPPKVSGRVTGWLKGEVQEFRDGVTREIDDFRSGWDTLRRRARQLGGKLRGE